jgi:hypothetical protein
MKRTLAAATLLPLAIGTVANVAPSIRTATASASHAKAKGCALSLTDCPEAGCADPDTPDGLTNTLKRHVPTGTNAHLMTVADFASIQAQAEKRVGTKKASLTAAQHAKLKSLSVHGGSVSDGDLVMVVGYIVGDPHPNTGESVNCGLKNASNNDIHITVAQEAGSDEMDGFVVEMIPQDRLDSWNREALQGIEAARKEVLVTGQLFYDSKHHVNDDPDNPVQGDPKRMSLWEVHPITAFAVCTAAKTCDAKNASEWTQLESYSKP